MRREVKKSVRRALTRNRLRGCEVLEDRRVLALLGILPPGLPTTFHSGGTLTYEASSGELNVSAFPSLFTTTSGSTPVLPSGSGWSVDIALVANGDGSFASGVPGNDFEFRGSIDIDGDAVPDVDGLLLTGEVLNFGFEDGVADVDVYDFRIEPTGGPLLTGGALSGGGTFPAYFDGNDIGVLLTSEFSNFAGSFLTDFSGGAKGSFGPIDPDPNEEPGVSVGDFVWEDLNANGIQEDGEPGIPGVTVNLKDSTGTVIATQMTGPNGEYLFTRDANDTILPPGTYSVEFIQPAGFEYTLLNAGSDDAKDSDADNSTGGMTATTTLAAGESDLTLDAGFYRPAGLGDFVWHDRNGNGVQDADEPGIDNATVKLIDPQTGNVIATTTTGDNPNVGGTQSGYYEFTDLVPGSYQVMFVMPDGFDEVSPHLAGGDTSQDSDADPNDNLMSAVVTLVSGEFNPTLDAGFFRTGIELIKYVDKVVANEEMFVIDFEGLAAGDIVDNQFPGVTISAKNARTPHAGNRAMIFDSSNPTGNDYDLGTPNRDFGGPGVGSGGGINGPGPNSQALGNILIISEDGDSSDPDDEAYGGTFTFDFDEPIRLDHIELLDIDSNESGGSLVTLTTTSGTQTIRIPALGNNSFQQIPIGAADVVKLKVHFVSSGAITELKYTKVVEEKVWFDANEAPGVSFNVGEDIEFSYHVTNPGDVPLSPVVLTDDNATPGVPEDDFAPVFVSGDTDNDGRLDPGEEWIYTATILAATVGQFTNVADVVGTPVNESGEVIGSDVTDDDPANYTVENVKQKVKLTIDLQGHSPTYGPAGNIRTFSEGAVTVNASAFSRNKSSGDWSPAYLGSFRGDLVLPTIAKATEAMGLIESTILAKTTMSCSSSRKLLPWIEPSSIRSSATATSRFGSVTSRVPLIITLLSTTRR